MVEVDLSKNKSVILCASTDGKLQLTLANQINCHGINNLAKNKCVKI